VELGRAGAYASLQGLAAVAGLVAGGLAADRARRRGAGHVPVIGAGLAALAVAVTLMAAAIAQRSPLALAVTLFAAAFFCWSIWAAVYAMLGEMVPAENLGAAFGLLNSISFLGAVAGPPLTGWVRDATGSFTAGCLLAAAVALAGAALTLTLRAPAGGPAAVTPRAGPRRS
jgi:MFS transporter, ACS family, D-galactonate transporter